MSTYGVKYYSGGIGDVSGGTFTVNLKKKDYHGGAFQITSNAGTTNPLSLNYRGGRDEVDNTIRGSEAGFNFYALSTDNYDDLLESEYQDWQMEILRATGSTDYVTTVGRSLSNDTSTGQAWSSSGTTAFNKFTTTTTTTTTTTSTTTTSTTTTSTSTTTTSSPNVFGGTFTVAASGFNVYSIALGTYVNFNPAVTIIPATNSTPVNVQVTPTSIAGGVTNFSFHWDTTNGSASNFFVNYNFAQLYDNTTSTVYPVTVSGAGTQHLVISCTIPNVNGHSFTLSGSISINGG